MYVQKGYCIISQIENYLLHTVEDYFKPQVNEWIAQMENFIDQETSRNFIADSSDSERIYDGTGKVNLFLDECISISKLTIDSDVISDSYYYLYPINELPITRIKLSSDSSLSFTQDEQNIKVEAKWGYSEVCPSDISFATVVLVAGIINFSGEMGGEVKAEKIGDYNITYKDKTAWADFERAKDIIKKYKKIVL